MTPALTTYLMAPGSARAVTASNRQGADETGYAVVADTAGSRG
jgi:hypothetical protein